jgi:zinc and cadmium transporter
MYSDLVLYSTIIFVTTVLGGLVTLIWRWSEDRLHLFLSFGAGVFLGAVFYHLLPEVMHDGQPQVAGLCVLIGYLLIFFIEKILLHSGGEHHNHGHLVVSLTALIGLSVHELVEGAGLAIVIPNKELAQVLFYSIIAHKVPAAFSLVSLMILARQSRKRIWFSLVFFAAIGPFGTLVLGPVFSGGLSESLWQVTGVVTGSFLYVATADLLPEVFHLPKRRWVSLVLMIAGIILMSLLGGTHEHH